MDLGQIMALSILAIFVLLIVAPPVTVWRALSRQASGWAAWLLPALALIGPFVAAFLFVVLMWLPAYSGQCGGWLGETSPCSGFGQYATETMFWAAMSMALPGLLGMLLGVAVLIVVLISRRMSRPTAWTEGTMALFRCLMRGEGFLDILEGRDCPIGLSCSIRSAHPSHHSWGMMPLTPALSMQPSSLETPMQGSSFRQARMPS